MEQPEVTETLATRLDGGDALTPAAPAPRPAADVLAPRACATCGAAPATNGTAAATAAAPVFVYAIGRIDPRFPRPDVEKEFAQAIGRAETAGLSDRQAAWDVLSQRHNRYLARQLCWVMTIEGLETYILIPRDPADLDLLIDALRPEPSPMDLDCVVGVRGPIASAEMCNGLMVPIVAFRSDLLLRPGLADQGHSAARKGFGKGLFSGGSGTLRPDHADDRQCWGNR